MKKNLVNLVGAVAMMVTGFVNAGAEVVVNLNDGGEFKWQFENMEDASEFLADRVESGRCSPKVVSVAIRSVYIDGLDDPKDKFAWYHGANTAQY